MAKTFDDMIRSRLWKALETKPFLEMCKELEVQKSNMKVWLSTGKSPSLQAKARVLTWLDGINVTPKMEEKTDDQRDEV